MRDPFRDFEERRRQFDRDFERTERNITVGFWFALAMYAVLLAVVVWAVIRVVEHFT